MSLHEKMEVFCDEPANPFSMNSIKLVNNHLPDFVRINPQEAVDWFFGLRIGVDWSNGAKVISTIRVHM